MVLAYFDASDVIIALVTADWTAVRNTRLMAQTFDAIGYPIERVCYVLNRAGAPGAIDPAGRRWSSSVGSRTSPCPATAGSWSTPTTRACRSCSSSRGRRSAIDVVRIATALTTRPMPAASVAAVR